MVGCAALFCINSSTKENLEFLLTLRLRINDIQNITNTFSKMRVNKVKKCVFS